MGGMISSSEMSGVEEEGSSGQSSSVGVNGDVLVGEKRRVEIVMRRRRWRMMK